MTVVASSNTSGVDKQLALLGIRERLRLAARLLKFLDVVLRHHPSALNSTSSILIEVRKPQR